MALLTKKCMFLTQRICRVLWDHLKYICYERLFMVCTELHWDGLNGLSVIICHLCISTRWKVIKVCFCGGGDATLISYKSTLMTYSLCPTQEVAPWLYEGYRWHVWNIRGCEHLLVSWIGNWPAENELYFRASSLHRFNFFWTMVYVMPNLPVHQWPIPSATKKRFMMRTKCRSTESNGIYLVLSYSWLSGLAQILHPLWVYYHSMWVCRISSMWKLRISFSSIKTLLPRRQCPWIRWNSRRAVKWLEPSV